MKVKEVFEIWKQETLKENLCINAEISGYCCGYCGFVECKVYPDSVRYGVAHCPQKCDYYSSAAEYILWDRFLIYYHNHPGYYNEKYNIDQDDPDRVRGYEEQKTHLEELKERDFDKLQTLTCLNTIEPIIEEKFE